MAKSKVIAGFIALILLGGSIYPAMGQTGSIADHVVINEIDINPSGDDSKSIIEWVELYNPTDSTVDIGGWSIASTTILKKTLTISQGTTIKPGEFKLFNYEKLWFPDVSELVELRDKEGNVVDKTPIITDLKNDFTTWQRNYDGYDTDSDADWKFALTSAGKSNGKLPTETEKESVLVSVTTDKDSYIFGETVSISGKVSERVFITKPYFMPEQIKVDIVGANGFYHKTITLYPDLNLSFKTGIVLNKVLGIAEGDYTITVQYAGAQEQAHFAVGEQVVQSEETTEGSLSISTDNQAYLPGQFVKFTAATDDVIPLVGLKYKVINPLKDTAFSGTLYPNSKGEFSGSVFMNTAKPLYGVYTITSDYDTQHAETTFELVEDIKEAKLISLKTDKPVYGLGEKVKVTGRLNNIWIPSFDIEVLQLGGQTSAKEIRQGSFTNQQTTLKILDVVRLEGDSTFSYEFTIPNGLSRLGDYRVTVSKDVGSAQVFFKVVENPQDYEESIEPFRLATNKQSYDFGEKLIVSGNVFDLQTRTTFVTPSVEMTFKGQDGKDVTFLACKGEAGGGDNQICTNPTKLTLTGVPNTAGEFRSEIVLSKELFKPGTYTIKATYDQGKYTTETSFTINESVVIGINEIRASIDKNVYGLGETVQLKGQVSERFPEKNLKIIITKPTGSTERHGVVISNTAFSWTWKIPASENLGSLADNQRSLTSSNFGTYKITISSERDEENLFFRVVPNPEEDILSDQPITVKTDKAVYNAGEKLSVSGKVTKRPQATPGLTPERVQLQVKSVSGNKVMYESFLHPDASGGFRQSFDMPVAIFKEGTYRVIASYFELRDEILFEVNNKFKVGGDEPLAIIMDIDKEEYYPGDVVKATGKTNKLIFLKHFEMSVLKEDPNRITCGKFYCGTGVPVKTVTPDPSGAFTFEYKIPNTSKSLGNYQITADTDFGSVSSFFTVVERPAEVETSPVEETPLEETPAKKVIEKFNRIADSSIEISVGGKTDDDIQVLPRVIQGSLFTSQRGEESAVNIRLLSQSGTCVIGPEPECMVSDSTRAPGQIHQIVEIDGIIYNVRYSGPDAQLEKFSIVPESSDVTIPDTTWNVEIIKDEQPTRFYYKVSYVPAV